MIKEILGGIECHHGRKALRAAVFPWSRIAVSCRFVPGVKTSLLSVAEGVKNTATPFTMDLPVPAQVAVAQVAVAQVAVAQPAYYEEESSPEYSEEESQSGTDAAVGETGIKSTSFLH